MRPLCFRCLYDLTGLPPDGTCPECGTAVAGSISSWSPEHHSRRITELRLAFAATAVEYVALAVLIAVETSGRASVRWADALALPAMAVAAVFGGWLTARAARERRRARLLVGGMTGVVAIPYAALVVFSSAALIDPTGFGGVAIRTAGGAMFMLNVLKTGVQFAALTAVAERLPGGWRGGGMTAAAGAATLVWAVSAGMMTLGLSDAFRIPAVIVICLLATAVAVFLLIVGVKLRTVVIATSR